MSCNAMMPTMIDDGYKQEIKDSIQKLRTRFPKLSKQIKLIEKQHRVNKVAYAGDGAWYDVNGKAHFDKKPKKAFKFKIEYQNKINNESHLLVFN